MKKLTVIFGLLFLALGMFSLGGDAFAQNHAELFPSWGTENEVAGVIGETGDGKLAVNYFGRAVDILIKFVAPLFLIFLIAAGVKMIVAGDNAEEIEKGKKVILYGVTGVIVIIFSYSLIRSLYFFFEEGAGSEESAAATETAADIPAAEVVESSAGGGNSGAGAVAVGVGALLADELLNDGDDAEGGNVDFSSLLLSGRVHVEELERREVLLDQAIADLDNLENLTTQELRDRESHMNNIAAGIDAYWGIVEGFRDTVGDQRSRLGRDHQDQYPSEFDRMFDTFDSIRERTNDKVDAQRDQIDDFRESLEGEDASGGEDYTSLLLEGRAHVRELERRDAQLDGAIADLDNPESLTDNEFDDRVERVDNLVAGLNAYFDGPIDTFNEAVQTRRNQAAARGDSTYPEELDEIFETFNEIGPRSGEKVQELRVRLAELNR